MKKRPMIVIDAGSVGAKAVFSLGSLALNKVPTGVIYGFLLQIQRLFEEYGSNDFIFCWDSRKSLRRELFPDYKKKRTEKDEREKAIWEMAYEQYDLLRETILPSLGFNNQFRAEGFEADDLLFDVVTCWEDDCRKIMVSGDEDMYQALDFCDIHKGKGSVFTKKLFERKYGITPDKWSKVKSIAGCTSDGVPGIPGVGEKTAIRYLNNDLPFHYKTYANIVSPAGKAIIERNKKLVKLPFKGTPQCDPEINDFNLSAFEDVCEEYGMMSFLGQYSHAVWQALLDNHRR